VPHAIYSALFLLIIGCAPTTEQGLTGSSGSSGGDGLDCWDANENGEPDPAEDFNGDGKVDVGDCQGSDGLPGEDGQDCWDTDGDGEPDPEEDLNGDGSVDVDDCQGEDWSADDTGEAPSEEPDTVFLGDLIIEDLEVAEYFCENYDRVYGSLSIQEWEEDTLDAMACLVEVTGNLDVRMAHEATLYTLELPVLERVGGELNIPSFVDATLVSFPALKHAGRLWFDSTQDCILDELLFPALETVDESFGIYDVFCIDTLEAPLLTEVGSFTIQNVDDLDTLAGFPSLSTVAENFTLYYNQDLSDVSGLTSLSYVGENFQVAYNSSLSDDEAQALAATIATIGGDIQIYGNSGR
jgi:hypothetical protein